MGRVVLVTGVAGDLGRRFARQLAEHRAVSRVIGVDVLPPKGDIGRLQFVRADIRNPVIAKVIVREHVDTVVHMSVVATPGRGGRSSMKELNVIGSMQLLAACQQAPQLRKLVVKSSSAGYGASSRDPAMFTEEITARGRASGYTKDVLEVESYVRGFARRRPDVAVTTLRMANVLGPAVSSPMASYFKLPLIPTVLGFDARLQFLHEHDMLASLEHATLAGPTRGGTFNVGGDGLLMLSQAVRRLGRPTLPVPSFALSSVGSAVRSLKVADFSPEQVAFLTYGRGLDTTKMRSELGFEPRYTTPETFADFASVLPDGLFAADRVRSAEQLVAGALTSGANRG